MKQALRGLQGLQEPLERLVLQEPRAIQVLQDRQVQHLQFQDQQVLRETQDLPVQRVQLEPQEQREILEQLVQ